jgi:hypothetical protein
VEPKSWKLSADVEGNLIEVKYNLAWVLDVMSISRASMVGFSCFTEFTGDKPKGEFKQISGDRSYARSSSSNFLLLKTETSHFGKSPDEPKAIVKEDEKPFAGGRPSKGDANDISSLCLRLGDSKRKVPLSDISILSKRAICKQVIDNQPVFSHLKISGGTCPTGYAYPEWSVYGYPMLCVLKKIGSNDFPGDNNAGEWRIVQCVFGAELTRRIRAAKIGLEVVSREGFGSLFPTLADLGKGIRLDPGLLPPDKGYKEILDALKVVDQFITAANAKTYQGLPEWAKKMGGMQKEHLQAVDRLMSKLLASPPGGKEKELGLYYASKFSNTKDEEFDVTLNPIQEPIAFSFKADIAIEDPTKATLSRDEPSPEESFRFGLGKSDGYGSESDYEEEEEGTKAVIKTKEPWPYAIKKFSVITGMAALRMATLYGMQYSTWLFTNGKIDGPPETATPPSIVEPWAPYFELDTKGLHEFLSPQTPYVRVLIFDGAPNPINIPENASPLKKPKNMGAIIIDTTNNTSWEKAKYLYEFRDSLAQGSEYGGVLVLVDSASKHPTGGDLVHGVIRVFGTKKSVIKFSEHLNDFHLSANDYAAYGKTLLSDPEHDARRAMIAARLITRNRDVRESLNIILRKAQKKEGNG